MTAFFALKELETGGTRDSNTREGCKLSMEVQEIYKPCLMFQSIDLCKILSTSLPTPLVYQRFLPLLAIF